MAWRGALGRVNEERGSGLACLRDWRSCRDITRTHARTFYFASQLLLPSERRAIHAVYAYCRIADDLVDGGGDRDRAQTETALAAWERQLDAPTHPVAVAFAETRARYDIPVQPARDLIAGIRMDLDPARYATWDDLRTYCYHVAGTIGLLVAPVLGCRDEKALPHAVDLGIAMQLTNIIRDVGEDARAGRVYLPIDELAHFGVSVDSLLLGRSSGRFDDLIAFQIERARSLYERGKVGIPYLSLTGQLTTLASANLYAGILRKVEDQEYDVLTRRAAVPTYQKFAAMPLVARSLISARFQTGA